MTDKVNARKLIHTDRGKLWLEQFEPVDKELAIFIANNLTLISHIEFERNLTSTIEKVSDAYRGAVSFFSVRELERHFKENYYGYDIRPFYEQASSSDGKSVNAFGSSSDVGSEARIAHIIRQLCKSKSKKYLNHPTLERMRETRCDAIVFVDDFIGSGNRVNDFLTSFWKERSVVSWLSGKQVKFHVIAYSGMEKGISRVENHRSKPNVTIYRDAPTFRDLCWGPKKMKSVENLFIKYAKKGGLKIGMRLGYEDGMASIVFEHGCPNNVPAVLWGDNDVRWSGLFPERAILPETASVFPSELVAGDASAILSQIKQEKMIRSGLLSRRGEAGRIFLMALALMAKGQRKRSTLSYATGLSVEDCERLIIKCIKWDFITDQRRLTPRGYAELNAAKKWKDKSFKSLDKGTDYYYPRQLRDHL